MAEEPAPKAEPEAPAKPEGEAPKTFTQEELDRVVGERLARERDRYSDYSDIKAKAEKLDEIEEAQRTEAEKAQAKLAKTEERATKAEALLLRYEVAKEKEVPAEAIDLLNGSSREDLEASADKILSLVKSRTEQEQAPDFDGGARDLAPEPDTPEQAHNKLILQLMGEAAGQ